MKKTIQEAFTAGRTRTDLATCGLAYCALELAAYNAGRLGYYNTPRLTERQRAVLDDAWETLEAAGFADELGLI